MVTELGKRSDRADLDAFRNLLDQEGVVKVLKHVCAVWRETGRVELAIVTEHATDRIERLGPVDGEGWWQAAWLIVMETVTFAEGIRRNEGKQLMH